MPRCCEPKEFPRRQFVRQRGPCYLGALSERLFPLDIPYGIRVARWVLLFMESRPKSGLWERILGEAVAHCKRTECIPCRALDETLIPKSNHAKKDLPYLLI